MTIVMRIHSKGFIILEQGLILKVLPFVSYCEILTSGHIYTRSYMHQITYDIAKELKRQ